MISDWFDNLVWGPHKVTREDERIRTTRNVNRTTEINGMTLLGGHSSHSYINGTNMYFNYFYDRL